MICEGWGEPGADTYFSFAIRPKVYDHGNEVVDGRVGRLVDEGGRESRERKQDETELDAAVDDGAGKPGEWPFKAEQEDAREEVDDLQGGDGLDRSVQRCRQEIPENLGPEEALNSGSNLVCLPC